MRRFALLPKKWLILALLVIAGIVIAAIVFWPNQAPPSEPSPEAARRSPQAATNKELLAKVADPAIRQHLTAQIGRSQQLTTHYSSSDVTTVLTLDIANQEVTRFQTLQKHGDRVVAEAIGIDNTLYTKDVARGTWRKELLKDRGAVKDSLAVQALTYIDEFKQQRPTFQFKKVGTEACGTLQCDKYEMKRSAKAPKPVLVWIDTFEHLLRKLEFTPAKTTMTTTYTYQQLPPITAPLP